MVYSDFSRGLLRTDHDGNLFGQLSSSPLLSDVLTKILSVQAGGKVRLQSFSELYGRPNHLRGARSHAWRMQWQPIPVLLPGKSHGRRSLIDRLQSMGS